MSRFEIDVDAPLGRIALSVRGTSDARALGIFGPSGAGKTSLVEALAGWRRPRAGRIVVDGEVWFASAQGIDRPAAERRVGHVPQDLLLFPHWNVERNVRAGAARGGSESTLQRAIDVLEIGALLNRFPPSLSGGERQRVALARALASGPRVLLLDEPLAALDLALRRRLLPYLARVREAFDVPLVLVSHDPTEILALCEECWRLEEGQLVEHGPARRVLLAAARQAGTFENVLRGRVTGAPDGSARVALAPGVELAVAGLHEGAGADVLIALRAEDILVATGELPAISARNVIPAVIADVRVEGEDAWVEARVANAVHVTVLLTPSAIRELSLGAGTAVRLVVKAQSCRVLARS